ncbi:efflux RND transporter periplasmic adaptor subunit [Methylobacterium sp. J-088]|uniref:efflux RND transporter periplasmic adaptor subunit n=1 Tax=unclassified Methylobacterium TaxID=2615210 RepID=UPI001FBB7A84|nr:MULTISPECIES: efflux RND transporter periplasmic adaptor subunit [unclassified Methylobacterium]MCJ2064703.1 efflux RND transporter periplasmic adaptor subunit [Methylobacterium sp. J-088]
MADRDSSATDQDRPPARRGRAWLVLLMLAGAGLLGYRSWPDASRAASPPQSAATQPPPVRVAQAAQASGPLTLTQTGTTQAFDTANLYPRATGYIVERKVDIGSHVKAGDLLFRISAPDLDQQLVQAQAQVVQLQAALIQAHAMVDQADANRHLADVTNRRTSTLAGTGAETRQNADTSQAGVLSQTANVDAVKAAVKVAEANIAAQEAQAARLKVLTGFEEIRAPFDGVVTARNNDVGDAVTADTNTGLPLLTLNRDDVLRMAVNVPLYAADGVRDGLAARVEVAQIPGKVFPGTVSRSSAALLYASRILVTQVDIPNPDAVLRPGLYITLTLEIPRVAPAVTVPSDALIFDQHGTRVAVVETEADGHAVARMRPVTIFRQTRTALELRSGLTGDERVIVGPPASLRDGDRVTPQPEGKAGA